MKKLIASIAIIVCILTFITIFTLLGDSFTIEGIGPFFLFLDLPFIGFLIGLSMADNKIVKYRKELENANKQLNLFINSAH